MHARRLALLLAVVMLAALVPAAAEAQPAAKRAKPCAAKRSHTWDSNATARIYEVVAGYTHTVYGCLRRSGKRRELASWVSCECSIADESEPSIDLIGRFVSIETTSCPPVGYDGSCSYGFEVVDLSKRKAIHSGSEHPLELLIKPNGSLAYITLTQVVRDDRHGTTVLEEGPGIQADSLATNGSLLYWISNGVAHAAPFD